MASYNNAQIYVVYLLFFFNLVLTPSDCMIYLFTPIFPVKQTFIGLPYISILNNFNETIAMLQL